MINVLKNAPRFIAKQPRRYASQAILWAALVWAAAPCAAHQKWLSPNFFVRAKAPAWLSFDVTWSDTPFAAEEGVGQQPLWVVYSAGERTAPPQVYVGKTKSVAEIELTKPGTYRLEAIDLPTYWTRIDKDGKEQWLKKPKNEVQNEKITRSDLYYSKAVAYVTLGQGADPPKPDDADPLDVVPITHPSRAVAGEAIELRVDSYGKPVAKAEIKAYGPGATGHEPTQVTTCDDQGVARIEVKDPGRHLFACELERQAADDPKADVHSFNVYLTILVQPQKP